MEYDDIISMPHHVSQKHAPMSMSDRAAQFAPFASLRGFDDQISESVRITSEKLVPDQNQIESLNMKLQIILEHLGEDFPVCIVYFKKDAKKEGGAYITKTDTVTKINTDQKTLTLKCGDILSISDISEISL